MNQKIALFLPALEGAGAERVMVTLANHIVDNGYPVDFVLSSASGVFLAELNPKIRLIDLGKKHVIESLLRLGRYLRREKPALLLSGLSNANAAAIMAGRLFQPSCRVVITQHSSWEQKLANKITRKERFVYQLSRLLYPLAAHIVAVSQKIAEEIKRMDHIDPSKVTCIYNPVVTANLGRLADEAIDHPWLKKRDIPVILGVGRLIELKDFNNLILSFAIVQKVIDCRLIILGKGPEMENLKVLVDQLNLNTKVDLPGFVPNPYAYMARADVFVLSSLYEGLPTALIEAMACGTTVVSTNCVSGPDEILDGGRFGDLVPVHDPNALAMAILGAVQKPTDRQTLKERADLFSVENATQRYLTLINKVVNNE